MGVLIDILSWVSISLGAIFVIIGGIGLLRMPDFFTRLHPAGITDTMGAGLILLGLILQAGLTLLAVKLGLIFVFLMLTSPASSHATARAALAYGLKPLGLDKTGEGLPGQAKNGAAKSTNDTAENKGGR